VGARNVKYRWLEVKNFRPFCGTHRLDFSTDPKRPVTLVFGANGGGKTSLLTAMYWCLYGTTKVDPNTPDDEQKLFNQRTRSGVPVGGSETMSVQLELQRENITWRITRSLRLSKDAGGTETFFPKLELTEIVDNEATPHTANVQFFINQLLDKKLGEFFFHAAETLQFPFDHTKGARESLRDCLYKIVGQVELDAVVAQAGIATTRLRQERGRISAQLDAHSAHQEEVNILDAEIATLETEMAEKQAELEALEPRLNRMLAALGRVEAFQPMVEALTGAEGVLRLAEAGLKAARANQVTATRDLWKVQAQPLMGSFFEWFAPRVEEFPRIVNQNLILHAEETGQCIFGHPVTQEEIDRVKAMAAEGDDDASRRLTSLYDISREWDADANEVKQQYELVVAEVAAAVGDVEAGGEALKEAQDAIEEMGSAPVQDVANLRQNVADKSREQVELRTQVQERETQKERLSQRRVELMRRNMLIEPDELRAADAQVLAGEMVENLASSFRDVHAELCRPELERQMNENYWSYRADRKIRIDENWAVITYNEKPDEGDDVLEVGGGGAETTLLTYAFAAATAKLIPAFKNANLNEIPAASQVQETETIPLVVDAPFSSLGENYQRKVAKELPGAVDQLILFNEATHLTHLTSMLNSGVVGKVLSVKYVGPIALLSGDELQLRTTFEFAGQEITYLEDAPEQMGSEIQFHGIIP
jgi:DNA sulfur modification protein DndD